MLNVLSWLLFFIFIAGLIVVAGLLMRGYLRGGAAANPFGTGGLFQPKTDKRLDVVEHANLDGRRKLVLVRRDNVEHLIMTGGPVDVVLETGIDTRKDLRAMSSDSGSSGAQMTRPARRLHQVGE